MLKRTITILILVSFIFNTVFSDIGYAIDSLREVRLLEVDRGTTEDRRTFETAFLQAHAAPTGTLPSLVSPQHITQNLQPKPQGPQRSSPAITSDQDKEWVLEKIYRKMKELRSPLGVMMGQIRGHKERVASDLAYEVLVHAHVGKHYGVIAVLRDLASTNKPLRIGGRTHKLKADTMELVILAQQELIKTSDYLDKLAARRDFMKVTAGTAVTIATGMPGIQGISKVKGVADDYVDLEEFISVRTKRFLREMQKRYCEELDLISTDLQTISSGMFPSEVKYAPLALGSQDRRDIRIMIDRQYSPEKWTRFSIWEDLNQTARNKLLDNAIIPGRGPLKATAAERLFSQYKRASTHYFKLALRLSDKFVACWKDTPLLERDLFKQSLLGDVFSFNGTVQNKIQELQYKVNAHRNKLAFIMQNEGLNDSSRKDIEPIAEKLEKLEIVLSELKTIADSRTSPATEAEWVVKNVIDKAEQLAGAIPIAMQIQPDNVDKLPLDYANDLLYDIFLTENEDQMHERLFALRDMPADQNQVTIDGKTHTLSQRAKELIRLAQEEINSPVSNIIFEFYTKWGTRFEERMRADYKERMGFADDDAHPELWRRYDIWARAEGRVKAIFINGDTFHHLPLTSESMRIVKRDLDALEQELTNLFDRAISLSDGLVDYIHTRLTIVRKEMHDNMNKKLTDAELKAVLQRFSDEGEIVEGIIAGNPEIITAELIKATAAEEPPLIIAELGHLLAKTSPTAQNPKPEAGRSSPTEGETDDEADIEELRQKAIDELTALVNTYSELEATLSVLSEYTLGPSAEQTDGFVMFDRSSEPIVTLIKILPQAKKWTRIVACLITFLDYDKIHQTGNKGRLLTLIEILESQTAKGESYVDSISALDAAIQRAIKAKDDEASTSPATEAEWVVENVITKRQELARSVAVPIHMKPGEVNIEELIQKCAVNLLYEIFLTEGEARMSERLTALKTMPANSGKVLVNDKGYRLDEMARKIIKTAQEKTEGHASDIIFEFFDRQEAELLEQIRAGYMEQVEITNGQIRPGLWRRYDEIFNRVASQLKTDFIEASSLNHQPLTPQSIIAVKGDFMTLEEELMALLDRVISLSDEIVDYVHRHLTVAREELQENMNKRLSKSKLEALLQRFSDEERRIEGIVSGDPEILTAEIAKATAAEEPPLIIAELGHLLAKTSPTTGAILPMEKGFEGMRKVIALKLDELRRGERDKPVLIVICGKSGTLKSTTSKYIELLRFGLGPDEVKVFEHDEQRSMIYYDYKTSRQNFPNLKLVIVEGYNTIPGWSNAHNPDLVVEFISDDDVKLERIKGRGWPEERTRRLAEAPKIEYDKISLVIDTSNLDEFLQKAKTFFGHLENANRAKSSESEENSTSPATEAILPSPTQMTNFVGEEVRECHKSFTGA